MLLASKIEKLDFIGEVNVLDDAILAAVKNSGEFNIDDWNIELNDTGCRLQSAFDKDGKIIY